MRNGFYGWYADYSISSEVPLTVLGKLPVTHEGPHTKQLRVLASARQSFLPARKTWKFEWLADGSAPQMQLAPDANDGSYTLRLPGQCDFRIDSGRGVVIVEALERLAADSLEHLLVDQVLPRVIAHQGRLVLHASCVQIGARVALFLGHSGWGKSTLAGLLQRRGHRVLSDDCVVLDMVDGETLAIPAYPGLRLFDDSLEQAFEEIPEASPVCDYNEKRRIVSTAREDTSFHPSRLHGIFLLGDPESCTGEPTVRSVAPAAACVALIENSFRLDPASSPDTRRHLEVAAAITRSTPIYTFEYRRVFSEKERVVDALLQHIGSTARRIA